MLKAMKLINLLAPADQGLLPFRNRWVGQIAQMIAKEPGEQNSQ